MPELSPERSPVTPRRRARLAVPRLPLLTGLFVAIAGLLFAGVSTASAAYSGQHPGPAHSRPGGTPTPRSADEIPNLTLVENQIKAYYGDTVAANGDHLPSATGNYAKEVARIEAAAENYLKYQHGHSKAKKAVVFDVDDTTLNTYNYEIFSQFAYNPTSNAEYVNDARFPEVYGMPALASFAAAHGYAIFFITGRPEAQRAGTVINLAKVGYAAPDTDHLYLKNAANPPAYLPCGSTCTTTQYKSGTRAHIESLGYDIVGNFGDQFSDLAGGYGDRTFKMPNPMYFLP